MLTKSFKAMSWFFQPRLLPMMVKTGYQFTSLHSDQQNNRLPIHHYIKCSNTIRTLQQKGISSLFPIQQKTYSQIYNGKNLIASDKTGSGKTIAFSLPVIEKMRSQNTFKNVRGIKFVILAPTRQLALQISKEIQELKHYRGEYRVATFFGGVSLMNNFRDIDRMPDIVVATPGRMVDLIQRGLLKFQNVRTVCIDQADYMLDIGFKEPIEKILQQIKSNSKQSCQYLCFTATPNNQIALATQKYMQTPPLKISQPQHSQTPVQISHNSIVCRKDNKFFILYSILKQAQGRVIIFMRTKIDVEVLGRNLEISNVAIHGDVEQRTRINRLERFKKGEVKILIATDVAARGLDISNVQMVINYDYPEKLESYVHRSGRTGRAGKTGTCYTFFESELDRQNFERMIKRNYKLSINRKHISFPQQKLQQIKQNAIKQSKQKIEQQSQKQKQHEQQIFEQNKYILFDDKKETNKIQIMKTLQNNHIFGDLTEINKNDKRFFILNSFNKGQGLKGKDADEESNVTEGRLSFKTVEEAILSLRFGEKNKKFHKKMKKRDLH